MRAWSIACMKKIADFKLLNAVGSATAGPAIPLADEDSFLLHPNVTGGSVNLTYQIEMLSPSGIWNKVAGPFTLNAAAAQPVIQLYPYFGQAIRANITAWTAGLLTVDGYKGASDRD